MRCPSIRRGLESAFIGWRKDVQNVSKTKNKKDRWVRQVRTGFWHDRQCKFHFGGNVRNCTAIHRSANRGAALMVKKGRKQDGRLLVLASGCKITFRINGAPLWHLCDFAICSIKHGGKAEKGASRLDGKIYRSLSLSPFIFSFALGSAGTSISHSVCTRGLAGKKWNGAVDELKKDLAPFEANGAT